MRRLTRLKARSDDKGKGDAGKDKKAYKAVDKGVKSASGSRESSDSADKMVRNLSKDSTSSAKTDTRSEGRRIDDMRSTERERHNHVRSPPRSPIAPLKSPAFWEGSPISPQAFGAVLTVQFDGEFKRRSKECRPLLVVTGRPLPFGKPVDLDTKEAEVTVRAVLGVSEPIKFTPKELDNTFEWTRLCMRAVMNSPLDCRFEDCGWLLLPLSSSFSGSTATHKDVAWDEVSRVERPLQPLDPLHLDKDDLHDAVLTWPKEFSRRYYFRQIRRDLHPDSTCPRDSSRTILQLIAGQKERHRIHLEHPDQHVIEGTVAYGAKHNGCVGSFTASWREQHLVPELLNVHMLRAGVFRTATLLPKVFAALDELLLADELSATLFSNGLELKHARQAVRAPCLGADSNERLAWLGRHVSRFIASVAFCEKARSDPLTVGDRKKLQKEVEKRVGETLRSPCGNRSAIELFVRNSRFSIDGWAPAGWVYEDMTWPAREQRHVSDKVSC